MDVRRVHGWMWCALGAGVIATVSAGLVGYRAHANAGPAIASDPLADPSTESAEPHDPPLVPMTPRDPFTPYPADPGAWAYEDQTPEMQEMIDAGDEHGARMISRGVHTAYSRARAWSVPHARRVRAEREANLEGSETLGVE